MNSSDRIVETLLRFNRVGPRYTSYPPANHFHVGFGVEEYRQALVAAEGAGSGEPLSLYVHLPFCRRRCAYCGCHSFLGRGTAATDAYLDDLEAEIRAVAAILPTRRTVWQLQWGGGTPNYLTPAQMERCFRAITDSFSLAPSAEVGVELDPSSLTREQVATLRSLGFNRVSLGVQDLDVEVQKLIGRGQSEEETRAAYEACREADFASVHFDLVYGLPGQTRERLARTLDKVAVLGPDRLALFGFAYLPTLRENQRRIDTTVVPDTRERAYLYADAVERLTAAGYVRIGMDHFARPGDELARAQQEGRLHRNFQGYTTRRAFDLIGFGVSAISDVSGRFAQNEKELSAYHGMVNDTGLATVRGFHLSPDDLLRRDVILALMCNLGVRFADIEARYDLGGPFREVFARELARLDELREGGFLTVDDEGIRLQPEAWPLVRVAAMAFDAYLHEKAGPGGPRYSSVV